MYSEILRQFTFLVIEQSNEMCMYMHAGSGQTCNMYQTCSHSDTLPRTNDYLYASPSLTVTFLAWTLRIWNRALTSGRGMLIWESNRPGRMRALREYSYHRASVSVANNWIGTINYQQLNATHGAERNYHHTHSMEYGVWVDGTCEVYI